VTFALFGVSSVVTSHSFDISADTIYVVASLDAGTGISLLSLDSGEVTNLATFQANAERAWPQPGGCAGLLMRDASGRYAPSQFCNPGDQLSWPYPNNNQSALSELLDDDSFVTYDEKLNGLIFTAFRTESIYYYNLKSGFVKSLVYLGYRYYGVAYSPSRMIAYLCYISTNANGDGKLIVNGYSSRSGERVFADSVKGYYRGMVLLQVAADDVNGNVIGLLSEAGHVYVINVTNGAEVSDRIVIDSGVNSRDGKFVSAAFLFDRRLYLILYQSQDSYFLNVYNIDSKKLVNSFQNFPLKAIQFF